MDGDSNALLYEWLEVTKDATVAEIKKNYRKIVKKFHPDTNPEADDKFKEISFAYEVLSDPEKRQIYDSYGVEGLQDGNTERTFDSLITFGLQVVLPVTLEDFYNGNPAKTVQYTRIEICTACAGAGGDTSKEEHCKNCHGIGYCPALGIVSGLCPMCHGRGKFLREELQCSTCTGKGVCEKENTVTVTIEKGMNNFEKIPFRFEGHQNTRGDRGDLLVVLQQVPHSLFQRKLSYLHMSQVEITLVEALCGLEYVLTHLDGRQLVIRSQPGNVINPNVMMMIKGEGMPKRNNPLQRGDLLISFMVVMPPDNFASAEVMGQFETLLPPRIPFEMPTDEDAQEVFLDDVKPGKDYYTSEEEGGAAPCTFS